jgi:hypothetical protein
MTPRDPELEISNKELTRFGRCNPRKKSTLYSFTQASNDTIILNSTKPFSSRPWSVGIMR